MKLNIDIRHFVEKEISHLSDKVAITNKKNQEALENARSDMNRRLEAMNEFRAQLDDQTRTFISRDEFSLSERLINQKIETLSKLVYVGVGIWLLLQGIIVVVLLLIFKR